MGGESDMGERIAKILARHGVASRRQAEVLVRAGRVEVDGAPFTDPAVPVARAQKIVVDGRPLPSPEPTRLFVYHKPRGLICTHADSQNRPTIYQALRLAVPGLQSVGRLDINSEGLLLLTNDGALKRFLELPRTGLRRVYRVRAWGALHPEGLARLRRGMRVDGMAYAPCRARLVRRQGDNLWLALELREGKNREIKVLLGALGLRVNRLIRTAYGPFLLEGLAPGARREIAAEALGRALPSFAPAD